MRTRLQLPRADALLALGEARTERPVVRHNLTKHAGLGGLNLLVDLAQRALPRLSREEICWRLHFTFGIEHMTHWDYARLEVMSGGLCNVRAIEESISRAVAFAKAAFLAP